MSWGRSRFLRDYATMSYTVGGKQEDHLIQANLSKWHCLALSLFQLQMISMDTYWIVCPSSSRPRTACSSWTQLPSHNWLIQGQTANPGNAEKGLRANSVWVAQGRPCWVHVDTFHRVAWETDTTICKWEKTLEWRYRGLVSIDRGGGLPGLPTDQSWGSELHPCPRILKMVYLTFPSNNLPIMHKPGPAAFSYLRTKKVEWYTEVPSWSCGPYLHFHFPWQFN